MSGRCRPLPPAAGAMIARAERHPSKAPLPPTQEITWASAFSATFPNLRLTKLSFRADSDFCAALIQSERRESSNRTLVRENPPLKHWRSLSCRKVYLKGERERPAPPPAIFCSRFAQACQVALACLRPSGQVCEAARTQSTVV